VSAKRRLLIPALVMAMSTGVFTVNAHHAARPLPRYIERALRQLKAEPYVDCPLSEQAPILAALVLKRHGSLSALDWNA